MSNAADVREELVRRIVKDAIGVDVVLPPRPSHSGSDNNENNAIHTADTHPLLEPYRSQGNVAPRLATYGHRPSSATRMFNPSTLGVTNRSTEERRKDKPSVLVTASVLRQILPEQNARSHHTEPRPQTPGEHRQQHQYQHQHQHPHHREQNADCTTTNTTAPVMIAYPDGDDLPELDKTSDADSNRPPWDDDFLLKPSAKARYHLKSHVMVGDQKMTTRERLDRFVTKATAMEDDTIYCKEKRDLDRHFSRMQHDAAYRTAQEKAKAAELRQSLKQQRPSQETLAIRELTQLRKQHERALERKVKAYVHEQRMSAVPVVNYDGALFNAAFKKSLRHNEEQAEATQELETPTTPTEQQQPRQQGIPWHSSPPDSALPLDKQTKMCRVYSEEPQSIIARRIGDHYGSRDQGTRSPAAHTVSRPKTESKDTNGLVQTSHSSRLLQYLETQPSVEAIVQETLRRP